MRDLSQAWLRPPVVLKADLRLPLAVLLLGLILLDAFQTRWQWTWGERIPMPKLSPLKPRRGKSTPPPAPVAEPVSAATTEADAAALRRSRFERAKRGKG